MRKKMIAVVLAAALVAAGLGSFAYAQEEPANRVFVCFSTQYGCMADGDSFTNRAVTGGKGWESHLRNTADASAPPVYDATLTLESGLQFDIIEPEPDAGYSSPPLYRWSLGNIADSWWAEGVGVGFEGYEETFEPGFDASRSVDKTEFTMSGTQTLQIEVIPRQQFVNNHLTIGVRAYPDHYVTPVITSPTTDEAQGIHLSDDGHYLIIDIEEPVEDTAYTYEVTLEVALNEGVSNVEFMPEVVVHTNEHYYAGEEVSGDSISNVMPEVGTWMWSATGNYLWERIYRVVKAVAFPGYTTEPGNKVQAQCQTHYHYDVLEDTFENQQVEGEKDWSVMLHNWVDDTHKPVKAVTLTLDSEHEFGYIWPEENLEKTGPTTYEWSFGDVPEESGLEARVGSVPVTFTPGLSATRAVEPIVFSEPGTQTLTITVTPAEDITNEQLVILVDAFDQPQASSVITEVTAEGIIQQSEHHVNIDLRDVSAGTTCTATIKIQVTPNAPKVEFIPHVGIIRIPLIPADTIIGSSVTLTSEIGPWTWRADGSYEWEVNASEWIHRSLEWEPSCRDMSNHVHVGFGTIGLYDVPGDTFINNHEVTGSKEWGIPITNVPDETGAPVTGLTVTLDSSLEFDRVEHEESLTQMGPPTYQWSFGDLPEGAWVATGVRFLTLGQYPVTFTPGFDASRTLDKTEFLQSDGTQTQTVTITLTPREAQVLMAGWIVLVAADQKYKAPDENDLVDAVITSATMFDGHQLIIVPTGLELDKQWTTTVEVEVTPKVPRVEFMPCVQIFWFEAIPGGTTIGNSVSHTMEQMGTWKVSAEGTYVWYWEEFLYRAVEWQSCCREIGAQASVDPYLAPVGSTFTFDGSASYHPDATIESYHWDFGDGNSDSDVSVTHTYSATGLYDVVLTVTDDTGAESTDSVMAVVYDPEAGFATGGGWLIPGGKSSDLGDMLPGLDNTSPANFGFVVKYKPGATTPSGQLEFQYHQGDFNLHSSGMEWLVIVNSNWAKFQGLATIKGLDGLFPFRVDARDGDFGGGDQPDRFIIKVYAPGADPDSDEPIYKASGDLEGGSIVIHAKKK